MPCEAWEHHAPPSKHKSSWRLQLSDAFYLVCDPSRLQDFSCWGQEAFKLENTDIWTSREINTQMHKWRSKGTFTCIHTCTNACNARTRAHTHTYTETHMWMTLHSFRTSYSVLFWTDVICHHWMINRHRLPALTSPGLTADTLRKSYLGDYMSTPQADV